MSRMIGYFKHGNRDSLGMQEKESQDFYLGQYKADKSEGFGVFSCHGVEKYAGEWLNGSYHGMGVHEVTSGVPLSERKFCGEFRNDQRINQNNSIVDK